MSVLDWFDRGAVVPNVYARSGDAEFIIDLDFAEDCNCDLSTLTWRECQVPVSVVTTHTTLAAHLDVVRGQTAVEAEQRLAAIREWVATCGGIHAALHESPLLLTIRNGTVTLEDGWHRLGLAAFDVGLPEVTALCAWLPDLTTPHC